MSTVTNAILVNLTITSWDSNIQDKQESQRVAEDNSVAETRMCRVRKSLVPRNSLVSKLKALDGEIRRYHIRNTSPWCYDGPRILMTSRLSEYTKRMGAYQDQRELLVQQLASEYEQLKSTARGSLGQLYKDEDYPPVSVMVAKFGMHVVRQTMPKMDGLEELEVEPEVLKALRAEVEASMAETYQKANARLWDEVYNSLADIKARLTKEDRKMTTSFINSIKELADVLPHLNITGDERLNEMSKTLKDAFGELSLDSLRYTPGAREDTAKKAEDIFKSMEAMMANRNRHATTN